VDVFNADLLLIMKRIGDKSGLVSWLAVLFFRDIGRLNFTGVAT
jgi:hypothetical protein